MNAVTCFNFSEAEDGIKEGLEIIFFSLRSSDPGVSLGRDLTVVQVPPNGGIRDIIIAFYITM